MSRCCICYTTDTGYLFPTFVSAGQARRHAPANIADVFIFSIGSSMEAETAFSRACAMEDIRFLPVPINRIHGANAMLSRLFLDRFVPEEYGEFLYIDGDTQIAGSLTPLLQAYVPAGKFYAAADPMIFSLAGEKRNGRELTAYFSSLGLPATKHQGYFNSGVLRINRAGWDRIGIEAWELFSRLRGRTLYPDQDALNLVAIDQRLAMSLAWNFPVFLRNAKIETDIAPRIIHYMSNPKPWHGKFKPWGFQEYAAYLDVARRYPFLLPFMPVTPWSRRLKYLLQQEYKQLAEKETWGHPQRRDEILRHDAEISFL